MITRSTITRRQAIRLAVIGGVALASTATVLSAPTASTISAQQTGSSLVLLGVVAGLLPTTTDTPEVPTTELDSDGNPANGSVPVPVVLLSFDVSTGQVQNVPSPQVLSDGSPILQSQEALTGLTTLADGTIVLTIAPTIGAPNETSPTRVTLLQTSARALSVSGLKRDEQLGDLVGTADGRLVGLVMKKNGTPPARLADIDLDTGAVSTVDKITLPQDRQFRTLTQCPDGTLFTAAVDKEGATVLVRLDLGQKKPIDVVPLHSSGSAWNSGLQSLMCIAGNQAQLLALGAPRYVTPNAVYNIDLTTGNMARLRDLDVARATLLHS